jgi:hypothetical protein
VHAESRTDSHEKKETAASLAFAGGAAVSVPPRGDQREREKQEKRDEVQSPGTKDGTSQPVGDLVELARVLAGLKPDERSALLALAQGLRSPAT